ncbi:hypothetical protein RJD25_07710 [Pontibacter sp. G13]|nr:hypothetical protein [Pontibacter sp. G13]WNJ20351.1 hypothetical protein RJD25_07710 [Pontibacter sp. G13]
MNRNALKKLVLEKSPFQNDSSLIKGMIPYFELYDLRSMNRETEGFKKWASTGEKILFHGARDSTVKPGEIDPHQLILFADFGLGNDTPFGLDYRSDEKHPTVVLLYYGQDSYTDNRWVEICPSFEIFEDLIWADH